MAPLTSETVSEADSLQGPTYYYFSNMSEDVSIPPSRHNNLYVLMCAYTLLNLCLLGILGNAVSFFVFTHSSMRSSINVLLAGLSLVDLTISAISIPIYVVPAFNIDNRWGPWPALQLATLFFLYQLSMILQTCSVYIFVFISVERYLAVCHPFQAQRLVTTGRTKIALFAVVIFAFLYNLVRFWEYALTYERVDTEKGHSWIPNAYYPYLRYETTYFVLYYTIAYILVNFVIPFSLICTLNLSIVLAVSDASRLRATTLAYAQNRHHAVNAQNDQKRQNQITRMIAVVTVIFLLCNTLPLVLNIWEALKPKLFDSDDPAPFLVLDVSNILMVLNSSINFIIYLIFCRQYRKIVARTFCCTLCRSAENETTAAAHDENGATATTPFLRSHARTR